MPNLTEALALAMNNNNDDAAAALPCIEAQAMELKLIFAEHARVSPLKPGDLIREKHGLSTLKDAEKRAIIFWRALDPEDQVDWVIMSEELKRVRMSRPDCLIGILQKGDVVLLVHETSRLELAT